ncbi:MAG: hypothetical protein ABSH08_15105 [Tepidisphaeraceae bacterium]|jgi:hypothetical protein
MRLKISAICIMIAVLAGMAYYFVRWHNYKNRPLFYNTYKRDGDGIIWKWDLWPPPLSDYQGNLVFADFPNNICAIVHYTDGNDGGTYTIYSDVNSCGILLGNKIKSVTNIPDSLFSIDESSIKTIRRLTPGEAETLYQKLSRDADRTRVDWKKTVHETILNLSGLGSTRASTTDTPTKDDASH